ncbi:EspG family protein [Amycolatopsis arida]|uniref:EspG family protein n=1 Tax=Amycolatopsis arida TaxID=587909 RepID=A0A1I5TIF8_9PSEU|nr:ESX secretion-associated protein EspG [Amycolatopsis arida]TDX96084.1 ESAT-6 protein secretion system EspG family protein [Amycolatopsis arida]SFP82815.1 EspG family protein [Amycolatopsis arida]
MLHDHVEISLRTYKAMLEEHNLGEPHITLAGGEKWYPPDERRRLREDANAELEKLGLAQRGRITADFLDTVQVLQRPGTEYFTWASINGTNITVRTARSGREGVLAIANDDTLFLWPAEPERAPEVLARQLPDTPPARVHSMSCAAADYEALRAGESPSDGGSARDARQIVRWLTAPRVHVGHLYAAVRDSAGTRRLTSRPPFWIDTEHGRLVGGVDGAGWLTVAGATEQDIADRLRRLEAELRDR